MINNLFYSDNNKNAIKSVISEDIGNNYKNNYDVIINETMQYVSSQVSSKPPKGMSETEYLFLMNKKVYDIVTPIIKTDVQKITPVRSISPQINKSIDENKQYEKKEKYIQNNIDAVFDPLLMQNYDAPSLMDYPKPTTTNKLTEEKSGSIMQSLDNERSTLIPKLKPIDFSLKDESPKVSTTQLYNELLTTYNTQVDSLSNFESSQKNINNIISNIEENKLLDYNNDSFSYTPINLLNNINETKSFFNVDNNVNNILTKDLSNNIAYNRNDIETFIGDQNLYLNSDNKNNTINMMNTDNGSRTNFNNDINTYSRNQQLRQEFSSFNNNNSNVLFKEPDYNLVEKKFYVIFDSSDRDLYEYPNQTNFQVKFSPAGDNLKYESYYDKYNTLIINEKTIVYGDSSKLSVQETFDNINTISCKSVNVPVNLIYLGISDEEDGCNVIQHSSITNIYKESYVYLVIPELRGPYRGGNLLAYNAFAKLLIDYSSISYTDKQNNNISFNFTTLKTVDENESFIYDPVSAGKIDKMTLNLVNKNGIPYNFGIDKLFVQSFEPGTMRYDGYCGQEYLTTKIKIQNVNNEYIKYCSIYYKTGQCNTLNSHPVTDGDLIYLYNTMPNNDQVVFFEDYVQILRMKTNKKYDKLEIFLFYNKIIDGEEQEVEIDLRNIIPGGDIGNDQLFKNYYIVIYNTKNNSYYYLKIYSFTENSVLVEVNGDLPKFKDYSLLRIGITKNNLRGLNDDDNRSLFNRAGYSVVYSGDTLDTLWEIEVNYPYENLPKYLTDPILYIPGSVFFIQEKMQISYTFTVTIKTKDYQNVASRLNESGNN